jgi:chloride channel protein, CIC family
MFDVRALDFGIPQALPLYLLLGVICGVAAIAFSRALYWVEDQFEKLPLDDMWWPAIGALGLGIIGYFVPRVLGVGYDTITDIISGNLALKVLLLVMVFKALALLVSLGSGTSGGLLAPMFMSSAASRATFTFIIFAFEITRDYNAVLPLMLVSVIADFIALKFTRTSIMTEKLARRGLRIHTDYEADVLQQVSVGETMTNDVATVPVAMPIAELADRIARHEPLYTQHHALPVVDADGKLCGIITRGDLVRAMDGNRPGPPPATVGDIGRKPLVVAYRDESLGEAVEKMLRHGVGRLPVVERNEPTRLVGYLGRSGVLAARLRRLEEEGVREPGWMQRFLKTS